MKKVEFQFAMDGAAHRSIEDALEMIRDVAKYVDIVEAGTTFILRYGMEAVSRFKAAFPDKKILADMKIMDGGHHNAAMGCCAGGDIITVLGVADQQTLRNATQAVHENGKQIMVDLLQVSDFAATIALCEEIGADYVCVHCGVDMQATGRRPYSALKEAVTLVKTCKIAVAGGIDESSVEDICRLGPDIIIVGSAIHACEQYVEAAAHIRAGIDKVCGEG